MSASTQTDRSAAHRPLARPASRLMIFPACALPEHVALLLSTTSLSPPSLFTQVKILSNGHLLAVLKVTPDSPCPSRALAHPADPRVAVSPIDST